MRGTHPTQPYINLTQPMQQVLGSTDLILYMAQFGTLRDLANLSRTSSRLRKQLAKPGAFSIWLREGNALIRSFDKHQVLHVKNGIDVRELKNQLHYVMRSMGGQACVKMNDLNAKIQQAHRIKNEMAKLFPLACFGRYFDRAYFELVIQS